MKFTYEKFKTEIRIQQKVFDMFSQILLKLFLSSLNTTSQRYTSFTDGFSIALLHYTNWTNKQNKQKTSSIEF